MRMSASAWLDARRALRVPVRVHGSSVKTRDNQARPVTVNTVEVLKK
jgi:hypothetical protein